MMIGLGNEEEAMMIEGNQKNEKGKAGTEEIKKRSTRKIHQGLEEMIEKNQENTERKMMNKFYKTNKEKLKKNKDNWNHEKEESKKKGRGEKRKS